MVHATRATGKLLTMIACLTAAAATPMRAAAGGRETADPALKDAFLGLTATFASKTFQPKWTFHMEIQSLSDPTRKKGSLVLAPGVGSAAGEGVRYPVFYKVPPGTYKIVSTHIAFEASEVQGNRYPATRLKIGLDSFLPTLTLAAGDFVHFGEIEIVAREEIVEGTTTKRNKLSTALSNGALDPKVFAPYEAILAKARWFHLKKGPEKAWIMAR